mmetsp:Transcript_29575/g.70256  ORF Transcript_29575/g.70256 Transcript_29575/m.70256 type:complete len:178 (-) Transcript_29575:814-1347(-)
MKSFCFVALFLLQLCNISTSLPPFRRRNEYTPLLFFTVPKGTVDENDKMDKIVRSLEKSSGIKVQRLDILRSRSAKKLYDKLTEGSLRSDFPLLYHRESLQRVYGLADVDLVRSWSKGRLLPVEEVEEKDVSFLGGAEEDFEDMDIEEIEMEMDAELTERQRQGKEAMRRRTQGQAK